MIFLLISCGNPVSFRIPYKTVCCSHHYQPQFLFPSLSPFLKLRFLFFATDSPLRHLDVQMRSELEHPNLAASTLKNPEPQLGWEWVKVEETSRDTWPDSPCWHIIHVSFFRNNHNKNQWPQPHCLWLDQNEISPQQRVKPKSAQVFQF